MSIYDFERLMSQTRQLASHYRMTTGQSLPVTIELARFDAITLLKLQETDSGECDAIDASSTPSKSIQIKGRVIFSGKKSRQRVGHLNFAAPWDSTVLVIYDGEYQPVSIYRAERAELVAATEGQVDNKRGAMTVAKFKAIAQQVWTAESESKQHDTAQIATDTNQ